MYRNSLRFGLRVEDRITMTDKRAEPRTSASRLLWGTLTVELDTHTVNLAAYDLSNIVLEDTDGTSFDATEVTVLQRTAHHLEAVLVFPSTGSRSVTLIARDLARGPG